MALSAADLRSFTTQGAQDAAAATYAAVQQALKSSSALDDLDYDVFLQGSYANATNTRGDSDVDVVVMLYSTYMPEISRLSAAEVRNYEARRVPGTVTADEFRQRVERALRGYFGADRVDPRNKCIRVPKVPGYVDADVVPALQHRLFTSYPAYGEPSFVEGISIKPLRGGRIVNYPKEHIRNGQRKNNSCSGNYKPTVRQVKRVRRRAVDQGLLGPKSAPGYLLECMVSNVPDAYFSSDEVSRVKNAVRWLNAKSAAELQSSIWSGDKIYHLFVDDPGQHNAQNAKTVLSAIEALL